MFFFHVTWVGVPLRTSMTLSSTGSTSIAFFPKKHGDNDPMYLAGPCCESGCCFQ